MVPFGETAGQGEPQLRPLNDSLLPEFSRRLMPTDAAEAYLRGFEPQDIVLGSVASAEAVTGLYIEDDLEGVIGFTPLTSEDTQVWLLSTPRLWRYPMTLARLWKKIISISPYERLFAAVDPTNHALIRFIALIGFKHTSAPNILVWHSENSEQQAL